MTGSARTCFLAMLIAETLILGLMFLGVRLGFADIGPYFAEARNWPLVPSENVDFAVQVMLPLSIFGVLLLWGGLFAFPAEAWPHGRQLRIGLLVSFLPLIALYLIEFLGWPGPPFRTVASWVGFTSGLALFAWILVHPIGLAKETWRSGQTGLCLAWSSLALAPVLAIPLWLNARALLWGAGLTFLAVRLTLALVTAVAWRPRLGRSAKPDSARAMIVMTGRGRTCLLATLVAEALIVGIWSLDGWSESVQSERHFANASGQPIAPNAVYDFVDHFGLLAVLLGILLLCIALAAFPKVAWPGGNPVRIAWLAGLSPILVLPFLGPSVDPGRGVGGTVWSWAGFLSLLTLAVWLMVHPLQLAKEAKRRGQGSLSLAWTGVSLATSWALLLSPIEIGLAVTLAWSAGALAWVGRLGLGTATAVAWRARPLAGGAL